MTVPKDILKKSVLSVVVLLLITATVFVAGCNGDGDGDGDVSDTVKDDVESYLDDVGIDDTNTYTEQGGSVIQYTLDDDLSTSDFEDMIDGLIDEGYEDVWRFNYGSVRGAFLNLTEDGETTVLFIWMSDDDPNMVYLVVGAEEWWDDYDGGDGNGDNFDDVEDKTISDTIPAAVNEDMKPILADLCDGAKVYLYFSSSSGYYDFDYIVRENMTLSRFDQMITEMEALGYEEFYRSSSEGFETIDFDFVVDDTNISVYITVDLEDDADIVTVSILDLSDDGGGGDEYDDIEEVSATGALGTELNDTFVPIIEDRVGDVKLTYFITSSSDSGETIDLGYVTRDNMTGSMYDDIIDDLEDDGWTVQLDLSGEGAYITYMIKEIDGNDVTIYIYFSTDYPQDFTVIANTS